MKTKITEFAENVNTLRNLPREQFSQDKKRTLINALIYDGVDQQGKPKRIPELAKDLDHKETQRKAHADKREILAKLESQGIHVSVIEKVKGELYTDYKKSQESAENLDESYVNDMQKLYNNMSKDNKLPEEYFQKIITLRGLSREIINGTTIINIPGAGRYIDTAKANLNYNDFEDEDKNGDRSINNIYTSTKFIDFVQSLGETVQMPEQYRQHMYNRIRAVQELFGITEPIVIDVAYIKLQRDKYGFNNLPETHPLRLIYKALYILQGTGEYVEDYFDILEDGSVFSVYGNDRSSRFYQSYINVSGDESARPSA